MNILFELYMYVEEQNNVMFRFVCIAWKAEEIWKWNSKFHLMNFTHDFCDLHPHCDFYIFKEQRMEENPESLSIYELTLLSGFYFIVPSRSLRMTDESGTFQFTTFWFCDVHNKIDARSHTTYLHSRKSLQKLHESNRYSREIL